MIHLLPAELVAIIALWLDPPDIESLAQVDKVLRQVSQELVWPIYAFRNSRSSPSLTQLKWSAASRAQHIFHSDRNWEKHSLTARLLCLPWPHWRRPVMSITPCNLIISSGVHLQVYNFDSVRQRPLTQSASHFSTFSGAESPSRDITGIGVLEDFEVKESLVLGREDGSLTRYHIPRKARWSGSSKAQATALYTRPSSARGASIRALSTSRHFVLACYSSGQAAIFDANAPWTSPSFLRLPNGVKPWSAFLDLDTSTKSIPMAIVGGTSPSPLTVFDVRSDSASGEEPLARLADGTQGAVRFPAAYAVRRASASSMPNMWCSPDQVLVTGWHDGVVRVHDLRSRSRLTSQDDSKRSPVPISPVMTLKIPTIDSGAVYCVDIGGGNGSNIVAGHAMHGCLSIFDVRRPPSIEGASAAKSPRSSYCVYPPNSTWSSTYDIAVEGYRIFGAGQRGPFVLDFGPRNAMGAIYPTEVRSKSSVSEHDETCADRLEGEATLYEYVR